MAGRIKQKINTKDAVNIGSIFRNKLKNLTSNDVIKQHGRL